MPEGTNLQIRVRKYEIASWCPKVRESDEQDTTLGTMEMVKFFKVQ